MQLCEYGCEREAKYPPRKGMLKWCCEEHYNKCPAQKELKANILRDTGVLKGRVAWNKGKQGVQVAWNKGKKWNKKTRIKMSKSSRLSIKQIKEKYSFFSKIEEIRYNPDKLDKKEIQVHCKNHNCPNSKEKGGWFTPTYIQLYERVRHLERIEGNGGAYLYCSKKCKDECPLYGLKSDPFKVNNIPYTSAEYQIFRTFILERDNYVCQFCGKKATDVHHERPQKLEPFFSLDPDFAWSCCEKCHYEKGHKDECSTGNLAKVVCSVESQKFLNQKI